MAGSKLDEIQREVRPGVGRLKLHRSGRVVRLAPLSAAECPRGIARRTELEWNHGHASLIEEMHDRFFRDKQTDVII